MPSPVYSSGTPGNLINGLSVAATKNAAAFLDLSTCVEGQVTCEMATGATAPTSGTTFAAFKAYAGASSSPFAPITLTAAAAAGATSLSVSSVAGLHVGQIIAIQQASGSKLGEIVTIGGISGTTLTVGSLTNSYSTNDLVYYVTQIPTFSVTPSNSSGSWAASKDYSFEMFLGTGQWVIEASNGDAAQSVTVNVTYDRITGFQ